MAGAFPARLCQTNQGEDVIQIFRKFSTNFTDLSLPLYIIPYVELYFTQFLSSLLMLEGG